jgi:uncharacterized membrane protein YfcA
MEIIGYLLSSIIGVSLGLIGGGGSILTVPILVYVFGIAPELSTAYSLFIVGITSLVGSYSYYKNDLISLKTAAVFGIPSIPAVFLTRKYIMPAIPETIMQIGDFELSKRILIMGVFAILMVLASFSMIKKEKKKNTSFAEENTPQKFNFPLILLEGIIVGILTGFVGAGGGFLIIPALVVFAKLPMKKAVGTSLLIIAVKSILGFTGDLSAGAALDWLFLGIITVFTIAGIFVGMALAKKIAGSQLKPTFGWFVLVMGIYILAKEIFFS